ncbi:kinase domain protein [Dictyocaulus viviparus]|uniref:Kinase domain protein n=1 Tax=Dictyocaulus viviparus TaxID=29172 RepID=A0A0D8Y932_DICVI|nr:kinase domain protein [Dictyocaulus viviparus]
MYAQSKSNHITTPFAQDDEMKKMVQEIKNLILAQRPPVSRNTLKIKMEYCGQKRCIEVERPVPITLLQEDVQRKYGSNINFYCKQKDGTLLFSVRNQEELDRAVKICAFFYAIDYTGERCLRLLLSKDQCYSIEAQCPDKSQANYINPMQVPWSKNCSSGRVIRASFLKESGNSSYSSTGAKVSTSWSQHVPVHWIELRCIGNGAFGSVYLVYDVDRGRDLALKKVPVIPDNREASGETPGLEFDTQELDRLQHPRIVQYLGVRRLSDMNLLFMEYMTGGSLKEHITKVGSLSNPVARRYVAQVLEGLAFLHKNHIIHRDIKSANILRDSLGNVKIADFGSGKKLQNMTNRRGVFHSTIHYTAPEVGKFFNFLLCFLHNHFVLLGKTRYGKKADVWSVGVTLVEMLTGEVPWKEFEPMAAMFQIAFEKPRVILPTTVESVMADLCRCLMNKNFDERPTANEVLSNHPAFKA